MERALAGRLVLVCAPAGFGKTALLADWARQCRCPVAWLSLDEGDNDPTRLWRHVAAALDRVRPGVAERVGPLLGPPPPPTFEGVVTALINDLAAEPDQALLILDDYHVIEAPQVHAAFAFLLEHLPPGLRLVLASRTDPPLPLARLRARGELGELRDPELRFTAGEAAMLLRAAVGADLPDEAVTALTARTEGWVAGLQLAGLSLQGHPDVADFVASFSGSHRYVLDFLAEEVLDRQPDEVRGFLLETSVLERLSGELCDAVTGRPGGQAMLERLERANLFLVPLDEVRDWWRYHPLFADLLRIRLRQQQPERVPELHREAAGWLERHGRPDDAVRHALAAGETGWAARLIEQHVDELILRGEAATLDRWLRALPAGLISSRPRLCLADTFVAVAYSDLTAAAPALDAAERARASTPDEPFVPSVGRADSLLANVPATIALERAVLAHLRGDAEATVRFAVQALSLVGPGELMLDSISQWHLGVGEWLRGRLPEAERALAASIGRWRAAGRSALAAWGAHHLSHVRRDQGRLDAALDAYDDALEITAPPGRPAIPAAGLAHVGIAEVAYQRNQLDVALERLTVGIPLSRQFAYSQPLANGLATLAWVRQARGDRVGAAEAMAEADQVTPGAGVASLLNPVPAQRARLMLAHGDVSAAARWIQQRDLSADDEPTYPREQEYLVLARLLLARDLPDRALGLLDRVQAAARAQGRTGSLIQIQALRGLALAAGGQPASAVGAVAEAVAMASEQGWVRVFTDEGPPMRTLLARLVAARRADDPVGAGVPGEHLGRLVRAFEPDSPPVVPGLVDPLSPREMEVLRLVAAGRSNQQIAHELVVAPDTVKKHVTHILEKLGVTNRTEATARARELGMLA